MHDQSTPTVLTIAADDKLAEIAFWAIDAALLRSEEDMSDCQDEDAERAQLGEMIAVARGYANVAAWNAALEAGETEEFTPPYSAEEIAEARSGALTSLRGDSFLR
jgi:hypothetical protein